MDRCLTSIDENVVIESPSPPRSQQSKKRDRPPTPTFEPPQNYYFETKKKKQEETTTTTKRKNSMDSSRERKKKKKTKKKKNNDNPLSKYLDMDQDKLNELYDVSMAYCGKCEEGGDMFCCSGCPGVYHPKCVGLDSVRRLLLTLSCVIIPTHRPIDTKKYRYPKMIGTVIGVNRQNRTFETSRTSRNSRTRNDACES